MTTRTSSKTVTFAHAFTLDGLDAAVPAGSYVVDTDEETIDGLSFIAWRRTATRIYVPVGGATEGHAIDPSDLAASLFQDAASPAAV